MSDQDKPDRPKILSEHSSKQLETKKRFGSWEVRWANQQSLSLEQVDAVAKRFGMPVSPTEQMASLDPSYFQTESEIRDYYRNAKIGDPAAIRQTHGGYLRFTVTVIDGENPKRGRIYLAEGCPHGGAAYYTKHGKSCWAPTGQARLVVPTGAVINWVKQHPNPVGKHIPRLGPG